MKNRQVNLQRLRMDMDKNNENTTYRPELNPKSVEIVTKKNENNASNPYERLYNDALVKNILFKKKFRIINQTKKSNPMILS